MKLGNHLALKLGNHLALKSYIVGIYLVIDSRYTALRNNVGNSHEYFYRRPIEVGLKFMDFLSILAIFACLIYLRSRGSNSVVECQLPKLDVAGSSPVSRSKVRFYEGLTYI